METNAGNGGGGRQVRYLIGIAPDDGPKGAQQRQANENAEKEQNLEIRDPIGWKTMQFGENSEIASQNIHIKL